MTVGRDPNRKTWYFVVDLPAGPDGRRRQMRRRGFRSEREARDEERATLQRFGEANLAVDGSVAAELNDGWTNVRSTCPTASRRTSSSLDPP